MLKRVFPTEKAQTAAPVGLADRWALRWQRAPPEASLREGEYSSCVLGVSCGV